MTSTASTSHVTDSRFDLAAWLADCKIVRTNRNSHVVWQIMLYGQVVTGPAQMHNGSRISGPSGYRLKRDAIAALNELKKQAQAMRAVEPAHGCGD